MISRRSAGIDAVRVFGIAAVIFGHVYTGPLTHEFIYAWHVPLFFFITGYLWSPRRGLVDEVAKRGRTLGLPYAGWFAVIAVLLVVHMLRVNGQVDLAALAGPARGGLNARGMFGTFWFVSTLFFTAILYRLLQRLPTPIVWMIGILGLTAGYLYGPWLAATPLAIGSALPCLIFVLAGRAAQLLEAHLRGRLMVGVTLIVLPLVIIGLTDPAEIDIKQGLYGAPVTGVLFACAISFGLLLVGKAVAWPRALEGPITELAVVGIAVVLFHPYVIASGRMLGLAPLVILIAAVLVSWGVALLLHRTPLSPVFIGSERRRPTRNAASRSVR